MTSETVVCQTQTHTLTNVNGVAHAKFMSTKWEPEEGEEFFCNRGLFVVDNGEWKKLETFYLDEYLAFYVEGGIPVILSFGNICDHFMASQEAVRGEVGRKYEVEGGIIITDGLTWQWVEED